MKVSELTGAMLDYWVAQAEDMQHVRINRDAEPHACFMWEHERGLCSGDEWRPSGNWRQGGPIIERERVDWISVGTEWKAGFNAELDSSGYGSSLVQWIAFEHEQLGSTPLVAAMRAYVAAKFGNEVPDNDPPK